MNDSLNNTLLDKLMDLTIIRYLDEIDTDNEKSRYDVLVKHFFNGDFDYVYESEVFKDLSSREVSKAISKAHAFQDLIFYDRDINNWGESVDLVDVTLYDKIVIQLLEYFDLLIKIYVYCGNRVLLLLDKFDKTPTFHDYRSILDDFVFRYIDTKTLIEILSNLTTDKSFNMYSDEQLLILLSYPEGVIYTYKERLRIRDGLGIGIKLLNYRFGVNTSKNTKNIKNAISNYLLLVDNKDFFYTVQDMYVEYQDDIILDELVGKAE